jgi:uncharacterized phiE125 gp8 family phage protein
MNIYPLNPRHTLTVTSPVQSFTEPLTLTEAREFCEIPTADTTRDNLLAAYITAAREVAEIRQGRELVPKQLDLVMNYFPAEFITLRENTTSVDLVRYRDSSGAYTTMVDGTDYLFDADNFLLTPPYNENWPDFTPWPSSAVLIRYTVTPPAVSEMVKMGMRYLISQWYINRVPAELGGTSVNRYPFCLELLDHGKVESV